MSVVTKGPGFNIFAVVGGRLISEFTRSEGRSRQLDLKE
jgi:hypothetical protein